MQIPVKLLRKSENSYSLSSQQISDTKTKIKDSTGIELDGMPHAMQRRAMLKAVAPEPLDLAFERYVGDNDLLPINYLETGSLRSKAVGRIRFFDLDINKNVLATGFLISNDLLLTNQHVFKRHNSFNNAFIEFDYEFDVNGQEEPKITFAIDPSKFFYAFEDLDFAVVGVKPADETGTHLLTDRGYIVLNPGMGKIGLGDYASIIQFPDGNWQQIALRENKVLDITKPDALIYSTDTAPGSSGAPVFNDQWQAIALHSAGVAKKDNQGNYLDVNGNIIPEIDGGIDGSQIVWVSNTGMRISSVLDNILANPLFAQNSLVQFLKSPGYSDHKSLISLSQPVSATGSLQLTPPTSANQPILNAIDMENTPNITINININGGATLASAPAVNAPPAPAPPAVLPVRAALSDTTEAKVDTEKNMDYSACGGFDTFFLGFETPLPSLGDQLKRQIAVYTDNPNLMELKYYHYSTIFHSIRRMPVVSAVNVDGNPGERQDTAARVDTWLRDNRIDFDIQLNDAFYAKSNFDKGHMSRREDAKWDDTPQDAERDAQLTCMYTNACPQVPAINRAIFGFHGLWGQLEQIVLEEGVEKEQGKTTKICVYNGPIFVNTDPTFKGVQTPLRFYKIIVWINGAGDTKTTAFVLSQEDLVGGIQFEELQFDQKFKEHQASVAYIENLTSLTFDKIRAFDTFVPDPASGQEAKVITADDLKQHIRQHAG